MSDAIREMEYPETPDETPGRQRDISIAAVVRQNDALQRDIRLLTGRLDQVIANQQWVNQMVEMAMKAFQAMPGMGAMMTKMMGQQK